MKLTSFQITEYRSVNDSGEIKTQRITAIVGRNESGKSNLLMALASLKPPGGGSNRCRKSKTSRVIAGFPSGL